MQGKLDKYTRMKYPYNIIFLLFKMSLIWPILSYTDSLKNILNRLIGIINAIITIIFLATQLLTPTFMTAQRKDVDVFMLIICLFGGILITIFRCLLIFKSYKLTEIASNFNDKIKSKELKTSTWISGWAFASIVMQIFVMAFQICIILYDFS